MPKLPFRDDANSVVLCRYPKFFGVRVFLASVDPAKAKGREVTVREVLDAASENIEGKFKGAPLVEASIRSTLGVMYRRLGEYKAAEPHLECVRQIRREQLGEEHPDTLNSMNNLANLYVDQSRYEEAEPLLVKKLDIQRRVLGEEDPNTLESMDNLAELYENWGRYDKAEPLRLEVMDTRRRVLRAEHPDRLKSLNKLIELYEAWGKPQQAEECRAKLPRKQGAEEQ